MKLYSYEKYLQDALNNQHTPEYLLTHLNKLSELFSINESLIQGKYTLTIIDLDSHELLLEMEVDCVKRVKCGFMVLDTIYRSHKPKASLKLVN